MAQIKDNRPIDDEGRVRLRKAVIARARTFIDGYKKVKVINPQNDREQLTAMENKCENR